MPAEAAGMPDPGDDLVTRVDGLPDRTWFCWSGRESVRETERTLAIAGRTLDSFESILDFGCDCGRMLLWLKALGQRTKLHGTDVDPEAISWARGNIPYCTFTVNDADPPLPYPDSAFDLIYNHSVFTHIDERRQDAWLQELWRVTRPGGFLVLTTHGERTLQTDVDAVRNVFDNGSRDVLEDEGIVFLDDWHDPQSPHPSWYQVTYHAPWYVFEHWGRWFEIRGYVPGGALGRQDHVLLHRTDEIGRLKPLAARPLRTRPETLPVRMSTARDRVSAHRAAVGTSPMRFGPTGDLVRRLVLRLMRPYAFHEQRIDDALAEAIDELAQRVDTHAERLSALERRR
jgi:SAM-dependent methyltransferase